MTHRSSTRTTELLLQAIGIGLGNTGLVGVEHADDTAQSEEGYDEGPDLEETFASRDVGILFGTEDTENFVLLVNGLAEVSSLLLVPPIAVGVSEGALNTGRVLVVVVL